MIGVCHSMVSAFIHDKGVSLILVSVGVVSVGVALIHDRGVSLIDISGCSLHS